MQLGISSYTYTWAIGVPGYPTPAPLTFRGLMEKAAACGVRVLQVADNLPLHRLTPDELAAVAQMASRLGLQIETGTRGIAADHLAKYLGIAQQLGSPFLRVVVDTAHHHPPPDEVVATLNGVLPAFAAAGVTLALENHDRLRVATLVDILERLQGPVGVCLDTVNSFGALEGPDVVVEALGPWSVNLHVKDFRVRRADHAMGFTVEGTPAGGGQLDLPWLLGRLRRFGRDPNAILELWTPPEATVAATIAKEEQWARQSIAYLRQVIPD